ncbi:MAG: ISLre2 family transposase, partial [Microcystis sp.]
FYHATQYLYEFAENHFDTQKQSCKWSEAQKKLLLNSQVNKVMDNIEKLAPDHPAAKKVLDYYMANRDRMDYKKYLRIGCGIIGSGAIESAHRTVVQKRLKLSG